MPKIESSNLKIQESEMPSSKIQEPVSNFEFQDILHLPHFHAPDKPYLSPEKRAAQFMPFKSLDTYEDVIEKKIQILKDQSLDPIIDYYEDQSLDLNIDYSESQENNTPKNNTAFF